MSKNQSLKNVTVIVKIGSAALAHPLTGLPDEVLLANRIDEMIEAQRQGAFVVMVTSGAINTGRTLLGDQPLSTLAMVGQAALMSCYSRILLERNMHPAQLLLEQHHFQKPEELRDILLSLRDAANILPIINEKDETSASDANRPAFVDNDELAARLAILLGAEYLILLTNVPGVYDRDGSIISHTYGEAIDEITIHPAEKSITGRGGMQTKLSSAFRAANAGITTYIAPSTQTDVITHILSGETVGTRIHPVRSPENMGIKIERANYLAKSPALPEGI